MNSLKARIAVIGGTGLNDFQLGELANIRQTPYGDTSAEIILSSVANISVAFLARHGSPHCIAPHKINYRANLWALKNIGVKNIIAVNAVGGIRPDLVAGSIVVPDQLVDYTYGREHTFSDGADSQLQHIDFTYPYCRSLRGKLFSAADQLAINVASNAVYAAVQGPRLETVAEINRLERDGCDIVGMTAMPEAALARELEIDYASLCLVVNPAAGRGDGLITMDDIHAVTETGMGAIRQLLLKVMTAL